MDSQIITFLITLAGISILPLVGFGTNLLIKKANESIQRGEEAKKRAELVKLGIQGGSLETGQKNAKIAIFATQQAFKNKLDTSKEEKKEFGMEMLKNLNVEAGIDLPEEIMSLLIEAGIWAKDNPPVIPEILSPVAGTTVTTTTTTPSLDQTLPLLQEVG